MKVRLVASLLLVATALSPVGATAQQKVAASDTDQAVATPGGAGFTQPKAWTRTVAGTVTEVIAPEGDLRIAIIDVGAAASADAAMTAAWKAWRPGEAVRTPKLVSPRAAKDGWEERPVFSYETSPNEKRFIQGAAMRAGGKWTVMIADGSEATFEKRGAAAALVSQSLRPAGYVKESFAGRTARPMDAARIAELRAFVETSMKELGIPGASFALTDRTKTIYSTGLGVQELGKPAPVDADTEFMIASNTKGMATLLLARLVDEGKIGWEQPVTQVYPTFRLGSDETTKKVLVRHLVCACTGLPRKDMEWLFATSPTTPASDTFVQLAATEPTSGFGEVFQYNNLMASAAGYIGGHLVHPDMELGRAFDAAMGEKVFRPLGMTATYFDFDTAMRRNWAKPHADAIDGRPVASVANGMLLNRAVYPFRPAGGAWSSANDLIKYVRFELNEGKTDAGQQWVSAKNLLQRRVPNVPTSEDETYGMGLETKKIGGVEMVHHGGSMGGYKSDIMLVPTAGIGAVLLTNSDDGQALLRPFARRLMELLYDGKPEAAGDVKAAAIRNAGEIAAERKRLTIPADPRAIAALAPAYTSKELGTMKVVKGGTTGVRFIFPTVGDIPMASRRNDDGTISFVSLEPTFLAFPLVVDDKGGKRALIVRDSQHEYRFEGSTD
jgi:CubicO group peptidase (beta-lactamase class C family)